MDISDDCGRSTDHKTEAAQGLSSFRFFHRLEIGRTLFRKLLLESRTRDPSWDVFEPRDEFHHKLPWDHGFGKCLHGGADSAYDLVVVIVDVDPINDLEQCRGEEAGNGAMIQTQVRACLYRGNKGVLTA